jgi:hypothetical protein
MTIQLDIAELIPDRINVYPEQRPFFQSPVEVELARLLTANEANSTLSSVRVASKDLRVNTMQWAGKPNPTRLDQQIDDSVYYGLCTAEEKLS